LGIALVFLVNGTLKTRPGGRRVSVLGPDLEEGLALKLQIKLNHTDKNREWLFEAIAQVV
jgi:hypothetical protein